MSRRSVRAAVLFWISLGLLTPGPLTAQDAKPAVKVEHDLIYGRADDTPLKLDLAVPSEPTGLLPVVVCLHGGGWRAGSRDQLSDTIKEFAGHGYAAVTVTYRLAPQHKFPAQIEDAKAAVRWLRANAKKYQFNPDRIGVVGFSAGAHLACLLGVTTAADGLEGQDGYPDQSSAVQAVVSFFGPTDLTTRTWSDDLEEKVFVPFLGATFADKPELYQKVSPVTYLKPETKRKLPPFLFFHGTEDKLVAPRQSKVLAEKLEAAGASAKVVLLDGEGHGWKGPKLRQTVEQMLAFFDEQLKAKP